MAAFAATGVILSATYMLWMFQRVNYGPVSDEKNATLRDLSPREWIVLVPIVAMTVLMGVLPNLFLRPIEPSVERMVNQVAPGRQLRIRRSAPLLSVSGAEPSASRRDRPSPLPSLPEATAMNLAPFIAIVPDVLRDRSRASPRWSPRRSASRASGCRSARSASSAWRARRSRRSLLWNSTTRPASASWPADNFGLFVTWILIVVGLLSLAFSGARRSSARQLPQGEYYALMLFAIAGMMLMATATDLLVIFLALEVLSLAVYVLDGNPPRLAGRASRRRSNISCSARSRARSSSTASRSRTA